MKNIINAQKSDISWKQSIKTATILLVNFKYWYLVLCIVVTLAFSPMLINKGEPLQVDLPVWTSVVHLLRTEIVPEQKWFWGVRSEREDAGIILGEIYSLQMIFLWMLSFIIKADLAVKLACWFSGLTLSLGFYFLVIRFSRPLFSAITSCLVFIVAFYNITDGMWYNQFSIALALWFWIALEQYLEHRSTYAWIFSIILLMLIFYCHPLGSVGAILIWALTLFSLIFSKMKRGDFIVFLKYFMIAAIAILLAAPQIFCLLKPSVETNIVMNLGHFPLKAQIGYIFNTNLVNKWIQLLIVLIASLGFIYLWRAKKRMLLISCALFLMAFAVICRLFIYFPLKIRFLYSLMFMAQRFQYWSQIIYLFWFAIALNWFYTIRKSNKTQRIYNKPFLAFLTIIFSIFTITSLVKIASSGRQITLNTYSERWEISQLFNWLNNNIDASRTRVFFEDTNGTYKWKNDYPESYPDNRATHILALSDIYTPILHIGGWYMTISNFSFQYRGDGGALFGMRKSDDFSEASLYMNMRLLNCQYLVANSPQVIDFLDKVLFLELTKTIGRFKVYKHSQLKPAWAFYESGCQDGLEVEKKSSTELFIHVVDKKEENLIVSIAYNRRWKAYADREKIPIYSRKNLICLSLTNITAQNIRLKYEIEKKNSIVVVILGFFLLIIFLFIPSGLKNTNSSDFSIDNRTKI